jgi:agmatinase
MKVNSPEDAEIIFQKLPSDMGIHRNPRKGTLNAPDKIMEEFNSEIDFLVDEVFPDEFNLLSTHISIKDNTEDLMEYGKPLVSIGGDHSVSYPVIRALKQQYPDMKLVWFDSHLDVKRKVDGHVSHDVVVRELLDHGFDPEEIYFVGTSKVDDDEKVFISDKEFNVFRYDEVGEFLREFDSNEQPVYLSIDIDVLSSDIAPGTGYPDGELDLDQVKDIIQKVQPSHGDLVEVAPPLDSEKRTLKAAETILTELSKKVVSNR